jgi:hypothetical protein
LPWSATDIISHGTFRYDPGIVDFFPVSALRACQPQSGFDEGKL